MGPGKFELLARVQSSGSLLEAAKSLEMSYMRAWLLVKTMNHCFKEPLVVLKRGGKQGGGAVLTDTGRQALELYKRLQERSLQGTRRIQDQLIALMKG